MCESFYDRIGQSLSLHSHRAYAVEETSVRKGLAVSPGQKMVRFSVEVQASVIPVLVVANRSARVNSRERKAETHAPRLEEEQVAEHETFF